MIQIIKAALASCWLMFVQFLLAGVRWSRLNAVVQHSPTLRKLFDVPPIGRRNKKVEDTPKTNYVVVFNIPQSISDMRAGQNSMCCSFCRVQVSKQQIQAARVAIDVALLSIRVPELDRAIMAAYDRGIQLRIITSTPRIQHYGSLIVQLWRSGVPVRHTNFGMDCHYNFAIVDGEERIAELQPKQPESKTGDKKDAKVQKKKEKTELRLYKLFFELWSELTPVEPPARAQF
ncbi:blast:Mitochondrial cardiolipin hydrolase [Drosophila guanche]|uniref:Blast:Mitochondrial cardiolipin hydrolase n=1 Tax=Drosophila guanche TaxID=7266 RepID=A0A3B0KTE8_DROGU|nr:blast:Mitochondrial cardiolipin hydrolase [Drosophila guanche]